MGDYPLMGFFTDMIKVARLEGVDRYILVDENGEVIIHNMNAYQNIGALIAQCGKQSYPIGKHRIRFLTFKRTYRNDLFIFPIGNYYLGVIKDTQIPAAELAGTILNFIDSLEKRPSGEQGEK